MKRTKIPTTNELTKLASELVQRAQLASRVGQQTYGGDRDIYQALGYPDYITYPDYLSRYSRQDIAKAVIDRPIKVTWRGELKVTQEGDGNTVDKTEFEKAWNSLNKDFKLKSRFIRADKLTCLGCYGIMLLGLDDVTLISNFADPVKSGNRKLLYVKPFGEGSAFIETYVTDTSDPRYGMPLLYKIEIADANNGNVQYVSVHYTRVIHIIQDNLESEIKGTPVLQNLWNRLLDLEKIVGGDAEMFWRGARPGYQANVDKDFKVTPNTTADLKEQIDEYENNLRRILVNKGIDMKSLAQKIADPKNHVDIQIQMLSSMTGIPKRILTGSERGELSSSQDKDEWDKYVTARREEYAEPSIVEPFVERMIELGILPKLESEEWSVAWTDLSASTEKEKVEIGKIRATALKEYNANPVLQDNLPFEAFLKYFLGFNEEQVEIITSMGQDAINDELKAISEAAEFEKPIIKKETKE